MFADVKFLTFHNFHKVALLIYCCQLEILKGYPPVLFTTETVSLYCQIYHGYIYGYIYG